MDRTSRLVAPREMLAMDPTALHRGADGFFWLVGSNVTPNARQGDVAIVTIRGPMEHHKGSASDNYESIIERYEAALAGVNADGETIEPPRAVIFSIDSVGGVVSGLNESIAKIRKMADASGIPLIAHINEMAASAAYAMCCACDVVYGPASCIAGSIGTISTMISVAEQDKKTGIEVRLITSGARKADGHIHTAISEGAMAAETERVEKLASAFFQLVSERRGKSPDKWRALQAAIFLGEDAKKRGLIDGVRNLDDVIAEFGTSSKSPKAKGNETDRRMAQKGALDGTAQIASLSTVTQRGTHQEAPMAVGLDILIRKREAALAASDLSPVKRARLESELATYKYLAAKAEGGEDDDEDEEEDEDDKAAQAAKRAEESKKKAEAAKHKARADDYRRKAAEADEEARKCMSDDDEEDEEGADGKSEASAAPRSASAPDAVDMAIADRLAALETERAEEKRMNAIATALTEGRISPHEAKSLKSEPAEVVAAVLKMRKGRIVHSEGETVVVEPKGGAHGPTTSEAQITNEINDRISQMGVTDPKLVERLRADMLENRRRAANGTLPDMVNGVPRY